MPLMQVGRARRDPTSATARVTAHRGSRVLVLMLAPIGVATVVRAAAGAPVRPRPRATALA
ncbi:hypothetical protein WS81_06240 [Burkholderia sp. MSMB2040]|nr:hypothetical protein WS77_00685 [Burkholderia sp. MSMB0265]KVG84462.1 hypothetical protein WS81_06240 [Burkholderia sp. MSMB2040]KVG95577.1 hypothetical protein WS82_04935 [Burkholderia sp. MSMB2041]KWZ40800.1 hypothetical protein WS73_26215 [Burkholderia savannae]